MAAALDDSRATVADAHAAPLNRGEQWPLEIKLINVLCCEQQNIAEQDLITGNLFFS